MKKDNEALTDYNKVIEYDQKTDEAYFNRGILIITTLIGTLLLGQKFYQEAMSDYSKAIEINSKRSEYFYHRGKSYLLKNNRIFVYLNESQ